MAGPKTGCISFRPYRYFRMIVFCSMKRPFVKSLAVATFNFHLNQCKLHEPNYTKPCWKMKDPYKCDIDSNVAKRKSKRNWKRTCVFQIKPYVTQGGSVDNDALEWDSRNEPIEMQASTSDITKLHLRRGGLIIFHCVAYVSGHWEHQKTPFQKYKIEAIINRPCPKNILVNASLKTQNATHRYT